MRLLLLPLLLFASSGWAGEIAALPVDAPGLLPGVRETLDGQLHGALQEAGFAVQDAEKTRRFIKDAVDSGLSCSLHEDECALKAAIAADVDAVVVARAVTVDEKLVLELRKVDVEGAAPRGACGVVAADTADGSLARLARRLVNPSEAGAATALPVPITLEPKDALVSVDGNLVDSAQVARGVVWLDPGPHIVQISRDGYDARPVALEIKADRMPAPLTVALEKSFPLLVGVGIGVGVGGGVLALACGVGTGLIEVALSQPQDPTARKGLESFGRVLVGGTVVGVVAAGAGTTVAVLGGME